jgi:hypothetical protein
MDFVKPMLNTPAGPLSEIGDEFLRTVMARVEAGRQSNRLLMGLEYYKNHFRLFSPEDWMRLLLIWETLRVKSWQREHQG